MQPVTVVIFDYSGTLSLEAVRFGTPGILSCHLEKSGLAGLGIDTPERYWQTVVNPTWPQASITPAGFASMAAACIRKTAPPNIAIEVIQAAVSKFVQAYLQHGSIDERWHPLLAEIQRMPDMLGLIATDHYAEATSAIRTHLAALDINAVPAGQQKYKDTAAFRIANSADIGSLKGNRQFWIALKKACRFEQVKAVVLVDDFGSNEQTGSDYARSRQISQRQATTRKALGRAFGVEPQILHFIAGRAPGDSLAETIKQVRKMLKL